MEKINGEETGIPREFLLKQIENEIKSGFAFVGAARHALKRSQPVKAEEELDKASDAHRHATHEVATTPAAQVRNVIHQLSELREAIDWLRFTYFEHPTEK